MKDLEKLNALKDSLDNIANRINSLKADVDEVSKCIETKRNISEPTSTRIISALKEINELNDSFKKMYSEIATKEELPDSLVEVESLITKAIEDYELNNKLSAYRTFLRLYSSDSKIMELLTIRKNDLRKLLDNYELEPEVEKDLVPYSKFVEAISETDPSKLVSYVADLTPVFGNELVGAALFTKNIFVSDEEPENIVTVDAEPETDVASIGNNVIVADNKVISVVENDAPEQNDSDDKLSDTSVLSYLFPEGFYESFDDSMEKKRMGTKVFINDMRQRNVPSNVNVMSAVDMYGAVSTEMIASYYSAPFSLISDSIQYLCKKGYLREYGIAKMGQYYCASPKGIKALHAKDARGFLKLKGTTSNFFNDFQSVTIGSVLARLAFTKITSTLYSKGNTEYVIHRNVFKNEYSYTIMKNKESYSRLVLLGIFLTHADDLESYYQEVSDYLDVNDLFYIISGANEELAKNNADLIVEKLKLEPSKVLYFSLIDNELRKYADDESVSFSVFEEQPQIEELHEIDNMEQKVVKIPDTGYNRHFKWLKEIEINYPAPSVQSEIVKTLDSLTTIISYRENELFNKLRLVVDELLQKIRDEEVYIMNPYKIYGNEYEQEILFYYKLENDFNYEIEEGVEVVEDEDSTEKEDVEVPKDVEKVAFGGIFSFLSERDYVLEDGQVININRSDLLDSFKLGLEKIGRAHV